MEQLEQSEVVLYMSVISRQHDFDLLKKLVLPDGSILRAKLPGRPTRDCLFSDPARDGKSLLKIWNMNDFTGVIGVFNCQGAGWCKTGKKNLIHDEQPGTITGVIRAKDVHYLSKLADYTYTGDAVLYSHQSGEVICMPENTALPITLKAREYDVFTVVPVKHLPSGTKFAPIGLLKMLNSGGSIKEVKYESERRCHVSIQVCGSGVFGAYSSVLPKRVTVDGEAIELEYVEGSGLLMFDLKISEQELYLWNVIVEI